MNATFVIEAAAKSLLVAAAALLLLRLLGSRSAAERSWVAHVGLLATLLVPFIGEWLPRVAVRPRSVLPLPTEAAAAVSVPLPASQDPFPAVQAATPAFVAPDLQTVLLTLYGGVAVLLLGLTLVAVVRLFALRRSARIIIDQPWLSALAHAQQRMGFKNGAALLASRELASPVSWGLIRPTIVIDQRTAGASSEAEAIIAHELAHVARLDWAKLLLSRLATALFWFNPLVWMLARQCHQLREEAADDAVLRSDVDRADYAALLVGAARHDSRGLLLAANGVAPSRTSLGMRVTRVLDASLGRAPAKLGWSMLCVGIGMAFGVPLAALTMRDIPAATPTHIVSAARHMRVPASEPASTAAFSAAAPTASVAAVPRSSAIPAGLGGAAAAATVPVVPAAPQPPAPMPVLTAGDWVALGTQGIGASELAEIAAISPAYARLRPGQIVAMRVQGITPAWLREMAALGYRDLPYGAMINMAVQDVSPSYIRDMATVGYRGLKPETLVSMRIHGVSPRMVTRVMKHRSTLPTGDDMIRIAIMGDDDEAFPPGVPRPPSDDSD